MSSSMKAMRVAREMSEAFCIALLMLTCCALSAQNEEHRVRNIVLVHGAWADEFWLEGRLRLSVKDRDNVSIVRERRASWQPHLP